MGRFWKVGSVAGGLLLVATSASAVDFRDPAWVGANGQNSFTVGGVTATASCNNPGTCDGSPVGPYSLVQDSIDGLGIFGGVFGVDLGPDEVDPSFSPDADEVLRIQFGGPTGIDSILITDLFNEPTGIETGSYRIDGGAWVHFVADILSLPSPASNGELLIDLPGTLASTIEFRVSRDQANFLTSDFSVAAITPVPEPATLMLLGSGLAGLGGFARRRLKKGRRA
jgi:hypothetical protein